MIRIASADDAPALRDIYNYYIKHTPITFEEEEVDSAEMAHRIEKYNRDFVWLVLEIDGCVVGYSYASSWRERAAYRFAVETSVYVRNDLHGKGYGKTLYLALLEELRKKNFRTAVACVALPNEKSARLHEALGFKQVAEFKEVGFKFNTWIDVGYWQIMLQG